MDDKNSLLEYTPKIEEPMGILSDGLEDFQKIQEQDAVKDTKQDDRSKQQQKQMEQRNEEIQKELDERGKKYEQTNKKNILQWVDLESSGAYEQYLQNWPNVNLPCAWCLEKFSTISWPLVVGRTKNGTFKVRGHHCSPNCALANGLDSREVSESIPVTDIYSWMQAFVYKVTGNYKQIRPAPPRLMLQKFGGSLTVEMFRRECSMENFSSYLTYPPLETSLPIWNRIHTNQDEEQKNDDTLVLKRSKPFYDTKQSLDSIWQLGTVN